jgi:hypothetical protein
LPFPYGGVHMAPRDHSQLTTSRPTASDLNPPAGAVVPNLVVVELATTSSAGGVDTYNHVGLINFIFDVEGWFQ